MDITPDFVDTYLTNAKILRMQSQTDGVEGGLVILFEKHGTEGIYIMGYTELGCWVYLFEHNDIKYSDDSFERAYPGKLRAIKSDMIDSW